MTHIFYSGDNITLNHKVEQSGTMMVPVTPTNTLLSSLSNIHGGGDMYQVRTGRPTFTLILSGEVRPLVETGMVLENHLCLQTNIFVPSTVHKIQKPELPIKAWIQTIR